MGEDFLSRTITEFRCKSRFVGIGLSSHRVAFSSSFWGSSGRKEKNSMTHPRTERSQYFVGLPSGAVPVSPEVYHAWYSGARQERYQQERDAHFGVSLFSSMSSEENGDILAVLPSSENIESIIERRESYQALYDALEQLPIKDQKLLQEIYWKETPVLQLARQEGVYENSIRWRRDSALKKLKKILKKSF